MNINNYCIKLAELERGYSDDLNSQIGVVIQITNGDLVFGTNCIPIGISKTEERIQRPTKYKYIEHAERNAIYWAARKGIKLEGSTLYMVGMGPPTVPCVECARAIIQSGIKKIVAKAYKPVPEHWREELQLAKMMLEEAGIEFEEYEEV